MGKLITISNPPWQTVTSPGVSPPFTFSRQGNTNTGAYLGTGQVGTDDTGQPIFGTNRLVRLRVSVSQTVSSDTTLQLESRAGENTRSIIQGASITIPNGQYTSIRELDVVLPDDVELCVRVSSGSCANPVLVAFLLPR